ncbi:MAG: ATP-dependent helicase HrpB, partial [Asticcacaulis sp.]
MSFLPIHDCLPDLLRALRERPCAVLVAPPGAGKTTVVPLALAQTEWAMGQKILVLEPRRLAARAAAARMATTLGESVGQTVGFRVRGESRVSPKTRIEVVTEGIFTRMILDDPGLDGVAAVLFDEFHERSLDADLGLAFARESQQALREDLRLLVMSATLDGTRIAALLDNAPVIESEGRAFPVETRYLGRDQTLRLEDDMVRAIFRALHQTDGSVLAFLPGQGEIKRVEERLRDKGLPDGVQLCPLYGAMDPKAQDQAIRPAPLGQRKIVLATAIAETSLTIDGVTVVVDSGFARVPRYDPATAQVRLETVRVTRAAADQRRGRAGRTAPGVCFRLWDAEQDRSLVPFISPEILNTDLSRLVMDLALWGARDPEGLAFLDLPPKAALAEARTLLRSLQALDDQGGLTPHGRTLARLPLSPRLAHMLCVAADLGQARLGADMAALLSERGLGGTSADLSTRLAVFRRDQSAKAKTARQLATDWSRLVQETRKAQSEDTGRTTDAEAALLLAEAWPERVALPRAG